MFKLAFIGLFVTLSNTSIVYAQTVATGSTEAPEVGRITGTVIDAANSEAVVGAPVVIVGLGKRGTVGVNGQYRISDVPPGTYSLSISFFGYNKKTVSGIVVKGGTSTSQDFALDPETNTEGIEEVEIVATQSQESNMALMIQRSNAEQISDAIGQESIRRSPDNNTGEVLKRVPGTSIQDGRFAVIRGLNDRYNAAYINGAPLPSTETDRRAFSFDLFPSSMIDNMTILKTATPDLPADFAGGVIIINTRDIPDKDFFNVSIGGGVNTLTTFNKRVTYEGGDLQWLGFDNGYRNLPKGTPDTKGYNGPNVSDSSKVNFSRNFTHNFDTTVRKSTAPGSSVQASFGKHFEIKKDVSDLGLIVALVYNNGYRLQPVERRDYSVPQKQQNYNFIDTIHKRETLFGAMGNLVFQTKNNKFAFKNLYTNTAEDQVIARFGEPLLNQSAITHQRSLGLLFSQNGIYSTQLLGEHTFGPKSKIDWNIGANVIGRRIPDFRRINYVGDEGFASTATITLQPDYTQAGRFYSDLKENILSGSWNLHLPFLDSIINNFNNGIKFGTYHQYRDRTFAARNFGYILRNNTYPGRPNFTEYGVDSIFDAKFYNKSFFLDEATKPTDSYGANSYLNSGYLMFDSRFADALRLVYGVRYENYRQTIDTKAENGSDLGVDTTNGDILPSANATLSFSDRTKLRLSGSRTLSRPEFRELAPFAFYDFNLDAVVAGKPTLKRAIINNYDIRFERYLGGPQIISLSLFYKRFTDPIESINESTSGAGSRRYGYTNIGSALNYGAEVEFRKNLDFIDSFTGTGFFGYLTAFGNFSYIRSEVDLSSVKGAVFDTTTTRPLQGQSPYIINTGLYYTGQTGLNLSFLVNRTGRRIAFVGNQQTPDIYENPRTLLDFTVSKRFFDKLDIRFSASDILAQNLVFYQDLNKDGKYQASERGDNPQNDIAINNFTNGRNFSMSIGYRF